MASCCVWMVDGMMAGSTTGVPMSPGYGGCQTATPPPYYTTLKHGTAVYYSEDPEYPKFHSVHIYIEGPIISQPKRLGTTPPRHRYTTLDASAAYYTEAPQYYCTKGPEYPTYAAPAYYTEASKYSRYQGTGVLHHYIRYT
jgi:hypothetical protein